jgi:phosphoesterase family protein
MVTQRFHRFCVLFGLSAALIRAALAGTPVTANLLVNGDAEAQRCTDDWTTQTSVPGWRVTRGAASVLCYSAFRYTLEMPILPTSGTAGNALFTAPGVDTAMEQSVDVSAAATAIDQGTVGFALSAWLGGWGGRPERATLTATFVDASGNGTGNPVTIADVDAKARNNVTALVRRKVDGLVPAGTRHIIVTVQFLSGVESYSNAFADNLSLTLNGSISAVAPATLAPPVSTVPALDHVYVLMMENTNNADVVQVSGHTATVAPQMPYTASLARSGVVLSNAWATYHPSDENYVAMVAGDTFKFGPVYYPYNLTDAHLGDLLSARGKSWVGYIQNMGKPCNLTAVQRGYGQNSYSPDDGPFAQFTDVIDNAPLCAAVQRDLVDFELAITADALPDFAWLAADNWWDGEGAWFKNAAFDIAYSNEIQDQFIHSTIEPLVQSAAWNNSRSLLILTWDEAAGWGWPNNQVPTILVGSPGLLRAGSVFHERVNGYDLLRTIEAALRAGDVDKFDTYAQPLSDLFTGRDTGAGLLWPSLAVRTRGSIKDTFGQVATSAAVVQGQPITAYVPAGVTSATVVNLLPLGQVPTATSAAYKFNKDDVTISIPTTELAVGVYGAWLRSAAAPPARAPMMVSILPPPQVNPSEPGVEIVGASATGGNAANVELREGSDAIVRYCLSPGSDLSNGWIGVFPAGTPLNNMTKKAARTVGFWLYTPGGGGATPPCGEAEAYTSELTPGTTYQVLLFMTASNGTKQVGRTAEFTVTPVLPQ